MKAISTRKVTYYLESECTWIHHQAELWYHPDTTISLSLVHSSGYCCSSVSVLSLWVPLRVFGNHQICQFPYVFSQLLYKPYFIFVQLLSHHIWCCKSIQLCYGVKAEEEEGRKRKAGLYLLWFQGQIFEIEHFPRVIYHLLWLIGQLVPSMIYNFFKLSKISL